MAGCGWGDGDDEEGWMMGGSSRLQLKRQKDTGSQAQGEEHAMTDMVKCLGFAVDRELAHLKGWSEVA